MGDRNDAERERIGEMRRQSQESSGKFDEPDARSEAALAGLEEKKGRLGEERLRITFEKAAVGVIHVTPEGWWRRVDQKLRASSATKKRSC